MGIVDILIILGCLGAGYWIVHAIMGSGIDVMRAGREAETQRTTLERKVENHGDPQAVPDWHIVLDVPHDASRRDIEAARKRRATVAENSGDHAMEERIHRAANWALRQKR